MYKKQVYRSDSKQVYKSRLWHKFDTRILKTKKKHTIRLLDFQNM